MAIDALVRYDTDPLSRPSYSRWTPPWKIVLVSGLKRPDTPAGPAERACRRQARIMPTITFTRALARFHSAPSSEVDASNVRDALEAVFASRPVLRGYVLDDQGALRRHVAIYVNGEPVADRARLTDPVGRRDEIHVFQALTGG